MWRRISDREVASSIPGCSAARCNSGQVVHTRVPVPVFTNQYKLVPPFAGAVLGMLAAIRRTLRLADKPAPLQHRSYPWLSLYSGLDVTSVT